jgi:PAS domain S-box-containing protein
MKLPDDHDLLAKIIDGAPDAILLVGADGEILLASAQTGRLFGYEPSELLGKPVELLVPERQRRSHVSLRHGYMSRPQVRSMGENRSLVGLRKDGTELPVDISLSPLETDRGTLITLVVRDATEPRRVLEETLADLKILRGLLPICAWCKRIRDDGGYWNQLEAYLRDHSEVQFSHGVCPDCTARLETEADGEEAG